MPVNQESTKNVLNIFTSENREIRQTKVKAEANGYKHGELVIFDDTNAFAKVTGAEVPVGIVYEDIGKNATKGKIIIRGCINANHVVGITATTKNKLRTDLNQVGIFLENLDDIV